MARSSNDQDDRDPRGLSRRGFLSSLGTGALSVAAAGSVGAEAPTQSHADAGDMVPVRLVVNGRERRMLVEPRWSLAHVLREELGLTGTKLGCDRGECGACTVLLDGVPRYACMTLAVEATDVEVTTVEGLMEGEELGPTQRAFAEHDAFQCGYCTSGQIMAAEALVRATDDPSIDEIREHMAGNMCRCGAYRHIVDAARRAAALRREGGAS